MRDGGGGWGEGIRERKAGGQREGAGVGGFCLFICISQQGAELELME